MGSLYLYFRSVLVVHGIYIYMYLTCLCNQRRIISLFSTVIRGLDLSIGRIVSQIRSLCWNEQKFLLNLLLTSLFHSRNLLSSIVQNCRCFCIYAYKVLDENPSRLQVKRISFLCSVVWSMIISGQLSYTIFMSLKYLTCMYDICFSLLCYLHVQLSLMKYMSKFLGNYICV